MRDVRKVGGLGRPAPNGEARVGAEYVLELVLRRELWVVVAVRFFGLLFSGPSGDPWMPRLPNAALSPLEARATAAPASGSSSGVLGSYVGFSPPSWLTGVAGFDRVPGGWFLRPGVP